MARNTIPIGLVGSEHTRNDGFKLSRSYQLNEAGQVTRSSRSLQRRQHRFGPKCLALQRHDHDRHRPHGGEHTRSDGYKCSDAYQLNEAGQVRGILLRYNGDSIWAKLPGSTTARPRSTSASRVANTPVTTATNPAKPGN